MGEVVGIAAFALFCHMTSAFLRSGLAHPGQLLLLAMVTAWGLWLAIHILVRSFLQISHPAGVVAP